MSGARVAAIPPLRAGEVHVWHRRLEGAATDPGPLAADERARAARFVRDRDRARFIAARRGLRELLARYLDLPPDRLGFAYAERGKPFLAIPERAGWLRFNLSHSHEMAVYAFARDREVGIDVEHVRSDIARDDLARRYFSPRDAAALRALPAGERLAGFFRIWTLKEAFIKATGEGVFRPLREFDVLGGPTGVRLAIPAAAAEAARWTLYELQVAPGYAAALAVEGMPSAIRCRAWSP